MKAACWFGKQDVRIENVDDPKILNARAPIDEPGDRLLLGRYASTRAFPSLAMSLVTDGLWHLFSARSSLPAFIRNRGMAMFNDIPLARTLLMQPAMR